jgi:hypothetical protein
MSASGSLPLWKEVRGGLDIRVLSEGMSWTVVRSVGERERNGGQMTGSQLS